MLKSQIQIPRHHAIGYSGVAAHISYGLKKLFGDTFIKPNMFPQTVFTLINARLIKITDILKNNWAILPKQSATAPVGEKVSL